MTNKKDPKDKIKKEVLSAMGKDFAPGWVPPDKRKPGNQPHVPTEANRKVIILARAMRMSLEDVAKYLGISVDTIDRHYPDEKLSGKVICDLRVAEAFMKNIEAGDSALIKYYMNNQMGFTEKSEISVKTPESIDDLSVSEFNKILADALIQRKTIDGKVVVPDRPLLPSPVRDGSEGHGE